jgi:hypothetical protein
MDAPFFRFDDDLGFPVPIHIGNDRVADTQIKRDLPQDDPFPLFLIQRQYTAVR